MNPLKSDAKANGVAPSSEGPAHRPAGDRHAVVERTLERHPWSTLSDDRGDQRQLGLELDMAGGEGFRWIVEPPPSDRKLPGPFASDLYVALGQLFNDQIPKDQRAERRTVRTTLADLAALMGTSRGGTTYAAIRRDLKRLQDTAITIAKREQDRTRGKRFHILSEIEWDEPHREDKGATALAISFHRHIADSIAAGNFRLLNVGLYFALDTPTARKLYRLLDVRRWRGTEQMPALSLSLRELADKLPIDREAPSHIKRTLKPAHAELVDCGYLTAAEYEERQVMGKKRPAWWVTYHFADTLPRLGGAEARTDAPTDPKADPDYLSEMVGRILAVLRDPHSTAFYVKCAKAFDRDALLNILGGVQQGITEGMGLDVARKTFTATAKKRASALGLTL